jgi:predicted HD phosphohydrolase
MMLRDEVAATLESLRGIPEDGERVDQLAHALQTAALALADGADDELVLAAALHDICRAPAVASRAPHLPHEAAAAAYCATFASPRTAWLVGAHVDAKRYLVAHEPYAGVLSARSTQTLLEQGGAMAPDEIAVFLAHPWAVDALRLRRWDDAAKVPGAVVPTVAEIVARLR